MTGDLIKIEKFQGIDIRVVVHENEVTIPVPDIATALGYERSALTHLIRRNSELFDGLTKDQYITTPNGTRQITTCLTRDGVIGLLMRMQPHHAKASGGPKLIASFQRWAIETLGKIVRGEIIQTGSLEVQIKAEMNTAKMLADATGRDVTAFQVIALERCGLKEYIPALQPPITHGEPGWLNPTQIAFRCGLTAREVNNKLYWCDFQYPQGPLWRLTIKGEQYGEEYWYELPNKHREIRIRWRESVLIASGLVREQQPEPVTAPDALAARA